MARCCITAFRRGWSRWFISTFFFFSNIWNDYDNLITKTDNYLLSPTGTKVPWSQRLSWNNIFFIWKFTTWSADRSAEPREKKASVKIVENLTFMLAQQLTAAKDVIFFWPITFPKIFNPSNHMTRRAIKNILQSETTVKSWWHESEDPNGLGQRLSFLWSQRLVPIKK